jgi:hypothetical protein
MKTSQFWVHIVCNTIPKGGILNGAFAYFCIVP